MGRTDVGQTTVLSALADKVFHLLGQTHNVRHIEFGNSDPDRAQKPSRGLEPAVQREQHLIAILAVGLPQVTEFDEMVDKRFGQVDGKAANPSRRLRRDRYKRRAFASTVVDTAAR